MRIKVELNHEEVRTAISEYLASRGQNMTIQGISGTIDTNGPMLDIVGEPIPQPPKPKVAFRGAEQS